MLQLQQYATPLFFNFQGLKPAPDCRSIDPKDSGSFAFIPIMFLIVVVIYIIAFILITIFLNFSLWHIFMPLLKSGISCIVMLSMIKIYTSVIQAKIFVGIEISLLISIIIGVFSYFFITLLINKRILNDFKLALSDILFSSGKLT